MRAASPIYGARWIDRVETGTLIAPYSKGQNSMKKSTQVPAALLISVAAATLAGCNRRGHYDYSTEVRRCVDPQGRVVSDYECERPRRTGYGYGGYPSWGYGGTLNNNGQVRNFKSTPTPGNQVVSGAGRVITRGGFGGSSSSRGGGGFFSGWGG